MKPRLACIFHELENIHLTKDVGMIPYILHKEFAYHCTIISYKNDDYTYLNSEVKGLKIDFIEKKTNNKNINTVLYLIKNSHKYDILQVYHPTIYNVLYLIIFKLINFYKKTKTHLKLDADEGIFTVNGYSKIKQNIYYFLLKFINVISVETTPLYNEMIKIPAYKNRLIYLPNGYYPKVNYNFENKKNIMICVGTVGDPRKNNEVLMNAFVEFYQKNKNWKLKFIGNIVNGFQLKIEDYFKENKELIDIVTFTGSIVDKDVLKAEYQNAKILILTSKVESFGMVFTEAMNAGCQIITSKVISANDVTNGGKTGEITAIDDVNDLVEAMIRMDEKVSNLSQKQIDDYNAVRDSFYWKNLINLLDNKLRLNKPS